MADPDGLGTCATGATGCDGGPVEGHAATTRAPDRCLPGRDPRSAGLRPSWAARKELAIRQVAGAEAIVEQLRARLHDPDFETKQAIVRLVVEKVVATGHRLEIHLALPVSGVYDLTYVRRASRSVSNSCDSFNCPPWNLNVSPEIEAHRRPFCAAPNGCRLSDRIVPERRAFNSKREPLFALPISVLDGTNTLLPPPCVTAPRNSSGRRG